MPEEPRSRHSKICGFTLVEMLVATAILLVVLVVLLQLTGGVGEIWRSSSGKISAFQSARSAFSTMGEILSGATLNSYNDYVDSAGAYRTATNAATFSPSKFARASELHFISGPAAAILPGASRATNPGDAVFFQVPLGDSARSDLAGLGRMLNSVGFYIQYGSPDSSLLPDWLKPLAGENKRFQLVQVVEPAEELQVYGSVSAGTYPAAGGNNWLDIFGVPPSIGRPRPRVLAEDIPLLIIRPRLPPKIEEGVAANLGEAYSDAARGSILSPNYHFDSRAWQSGYPGGRVEGGLVELTRNQLPPIIDIVMVAIDRRSIARFDSSSATPNEELQVPASLFLDSSRLEQDLQTYADQLSSANIRYRIFRMAVNVRGAKWTNNQ